MTAICTSTLPKCCYFIQKDLSSQNQDLSWCRCGVYPYINGRDVNLMMLDYQNGMEIMFSLLME